MVCVSSVNTGYDLKSIFTGALLHLYSRGICSFCIHHMDMQSLSEADVSPTYGWFSVKMK